MSGFTELLPLNFTILSSMLFALLYVTVYSQVLRGSGK